MDVRTPFFQNIACVLIGVMFLNPIVATAAELALDAQAGGNAAVTQAANGVPMINIATPNGSGLSHNKFTDFNVSQQGLILNNSAQAVVQTQLGGYVMGNPNLKGGAASVILNEVNGGSPSQLKGYTEVAGKSAAVIVANPHGISCDGCGFINTPRVTLSTGKPVVEGGRLDRFDVEGGQISIEGDGLNARNVSQFDLITRSAQINVELHANQLNVITGRNEVDAASLSTTAKADDGSAKPQLAIDSSALGGMYAGAIRLVGTEAGVGVKLAGDMAASAGDIQIDANGQLSMARTAAGRDLQLKADNIELNADTFAGRNAMVEASGQTLVKESLAAGQQLTAKGVELLNQGVVEAGVRADGSLNSAATLNLQTDTLKNTGTITSHGSLEAEVQTLNNQGGSLTAGGDAALKAETLNNQGGQVLAQRDLSIEVDVINNSSGELLAGRDLSVAGSSLNNHGGIAASNAAIKVELSGTLNNTSGLVEAGSTLAVSSESLSNSNGGLRALGSSGTSTFAIADLFNNHNGKIEIGNTGLRLNAARFEQASGGRLLALGSLDAEGANWRNDGEMDTQATRLQLTGSYRGNGSLLSEQDLFITTDSLELEDDAQIRTSGQAQLQLAGELRSSGVITATQGLTLAAGKVRNLGTLGSAGAVRVDTQELVNENGLLFSGADMQLRSKALTNRFGDIYSFGSLDFALDDQHSRAELLENISGTIESVADMRLAVDSLINRKDKLAFHQRLVSGQIVLTGTDNCKGDHCEASYYATETFGPHITEDSASASLLAGGDLRFTGGAFDNRFSSVSAGNDIVINTDSFSNTGAGGGEQRYASYYIYTKSDSAYWAFINNMGAYNAYNDPASASYNPGYLSLSGIALGSQTSGSVTATSGDVVAPAVVQAGGNVDIVGLQTVANAVVREGETTQPGASRVADTQLGATQPPTLNQQLPPELAQQTIDPLALPGFSLPQGQNGLFSLSQNPEHPYLIETNPAFASLGSFLNSGYLLDAVGYNPDQTQRRLGDGLYEQRLIQQAVTARTGKRLLDGLASDEAQYKYLMDNAIASKQALELVPGIALTAEQVAALTHDIVWMQEQEVNGHKVLVPVLYMAQANDRLAPTGALIQGQDIALISGGKLQNSGTLRAKVNLDIEAKNIANSGLMQANERLQLLAEDSIRNARGGIINGKDVTLFTEHGDISNERSIGTSVGRDGGFSWSQSVADNAARIEAGNDLVLDAGRDLRNVGGALQAGGDAQLLAGRDLLITAATEVDSTQAQFKKARASSQTITQHGSEVNIGGDLAVEAGRDITLVASKVQVGRDLDMSADGDIAILSAANESHSFAQSKKVTISNDQVRQQASVIQVGRDVSIDAGQDLTLVASQIKAGNDVALNADQDVQVLSAQDESASYYYKKSKGSFGRSKSVEQASYHSTNVASVIEAGNDLSINTSKAADGSLTLEGGRDVAVIGSTLKAGNDLLVGGQGNVSVLSGMEEHGTFYEKKKSGSFGLSKSAKSQVSTSSNHVASELTAGNDVLVLAGNDINFRASNANAGNDVELHAGLVTDTGDINLVAANDTAYSRAEAYKKKVGLSGGDFAGLMLGSPSWGGDITLASTKKSGSETQSSTNVGSQIMAERDVTLIAERDINVIGSGVSAGRNALLDAERDVNIVAGSSSQQTTSWKNTKTLGMQQSMDDNGFTTFVGEEKLKDKLINGQQTAAGSLIDAGLDIDIRAGRDIVQRGSDLDAGYDLSLQAGRNILIDAAREQSLTAREQSQKRAGTSTTVNHNFGNTMDALNGAGKGDNTVSQASSTLKAVDGVSQFLSGPTFDAHIGSTGYSQSVTQAVQGNRASTLAAGNDINLSANNDVAVRGGQFASGRDINVSGKDVVFDVARGEQRYENQQTQSKGGIVGGTTGGFKIGIGGSSGTATQDGSQGTSSGAQLNAQRDVNLKASNDLSLIGTQVQAGRDIDLNAGNDLTIGAAGNDFENEERRRNGGGEVGLTFGSEGVGVYVSVNVGRGQLDREGAQQQEAYLYAGRDLNFESGRDTTVAGATLQGENVTGEVGRNLTVSSVPDTGKVRGKELDISATATFGPGAGFSASVGYGQTTGKTNWVGNQTAITARDKLDIRTEEHTQIDGAVIASQTGNLKLDTDTLGFRDIKGEDKEQSYYLNVGGSYGAGQQDKSQEGKGEAGVNGWSVNGYEFEKEREQIVRATVGDGEIVVRSDAETGKDSTTGLNRDTGKAYEITKDEEERTDLYVSKSSIEALSDPKATVKQWATALATYDETAKANLEEISTGLNVTYNRLEKTLGRELPPGARETGGADIAEAALEAMLLRGKSLSEAKSLLADEGFQQGLLSHLKALDNLSKSGVITLLKIDVESGEWVESAGTRKPISPQTVLRKLAAINSYLEDNPESATALAWGMAALQGPKAVVQLAAEQALGATDLGQRFTEYVAELQYELGKQVAEKIENKDLHEEEIKDKLLIGGGNLLVSIIAGTTPVRGVGGKTEIHIGKNDVDSKDNSGATTSSKPEWLQRLDAGNEFNRVQSKNYPYNEVYIQRPDGNGYYRVDSYNPVTGEIVSRKLTQLSEVSEATAKSYVSEAINKYPAGATIAKVQSSGSLGGQKLQGTVILEVPPQKNAIPQSVLDAANKAGVLIRDVNGRVY